jgi:hypothetical protein
MERRQVVRIPPKRLRLLGIFCGCTAGGFLTLLEVIGVSRAIAQVHANVHDLLLAPILLLLLACGAITTISLAVFALWALVRLVLFLPALILTPRGIINHSIVYHVVLPWDEIESFSRLQRHTMTDFVVLFKDDGHVNALQQPFTRLLLWVFISLVPTNISTKTVAGTPDALWERLRRYVHDEVPDQHIQFTTIGAARPTSPTPTHRGE